MSDNNSTEAQPWPEADVEVAQSWLKMLFAQCDTGWVTLFSIPPKDSGRTVRTDWAPVASLDFFRPFIEAKAPVDNLYVGLATRRERLDGGKRGGARDCLQLTALWADLDDNTGFHSGSERHSLPLPPDRDASRLLLGDLGLPPSSVIDSGGGLQAYYLLSGPMDVDAEAIALLDRFGATWQTLGGTRGWHVDNVFDAPRIMRLPGTLNHKGAAFGHPPVIVTVEHLDRERMYTTEEVRAKTIDTVRSTTTANGTTTPVLAYRRGAGKDDTAAGRPSAPSLSENADRPGSLFNEHWTGGAVLTMFDWTLHRTDSNGDQHWHRPGSANASGATVYADDGRTVIWSESVGDQVPTSRPMDAFGLLTVLTFGDLTDDSFRSAAEMIEAEGLVEPEVLRIVDPDYEESEPAPDLRDHDVGNAERLVEQHGDRFRYVGAWNRWVAWDGTRWRTDEKGQIVEAAKSVAAAMVDSAIDDKEARRLRGWAKKSKMRKGIEAMVHLARSDPAVAIAPDVLDADGWALNVVNGVIDLRTGELHPHDPDRLMTKLAPVIYDPAATSPTWDRFLETILPDEEVREFVARALGYGLTGEVTEHKLFVAHGSGANGKTTLAETLQALLGDYAQEAEPDLLLARGDTHPTGIARLHGKRVVWASENDENRRLAEGTIKRLTGGDKVTARFLYRDFFEFVPTHKLWLLTNHRPAVQGTDDGIWRRLRLIPFTVTIQPERQDKNLVAKLLAESSGILNWLLDACLRWQAGGLTEPLAVTLATAGYRAEMDTLAEFIGDFCEIGESCMTDAASLYATYKLWCSLNGEEPVAQALLGRRLTDRGFTRTRHGVERRSHWRGLTVRASRMLGNPS